MADWAELEIRLFPRDILNDKKGRANQGVCQYGIELRANAPDDSVRRGVIQGVMSINTTELNGFSLDPKGYGKKLCDSLLGDPEILTYFETIRAVTIDQSHKYLRISLNIDPSLTELHNLRWETLCYPDEHTWLSCSQSLLFSRFLTAPGLDSPQARLKSELKVLVAISNPADLNTGQITAGGKTLGTIDNLDGVRDRIRHALDPLKPDELVTDPNTPGQVCLNNLARQLEKGCDILYLVCHGGLQNGTPYLYLEDEQVAGKGAWIEGQALVSRIGALPANLRPRLVVLASCESAGKASDETGALAAVGPQLSQTGVLSVLAMLGSVSMDTVDQFMPTFFQKLLECGQVDLAVASARGVIALRDDCWMPVLYQRLRDGRFWYTPGIAGSSSSPENELWDTLWKAANLYYLQKKCTPLIGPGLSESYLGTRSMIASSLVKTNGFPLADQDSEELTKVAEYIATAVAKGYLRENYQLALSEQVRSRYKSLLPDDAEDLELPQLMQTVYQVINQLEPTNAYCLLATLDFPVYFTANPDTLLAEALRAKQKQPTEIVCYWRLEDDRRIDMTTIPRPTAKAPWIVYLFGRVDDPQSLVLTLDDFFEYLIVVNSENRIPADIWRKMTSCMMLFLGFQIQDWDFRVIFRSLMGQRGTGQLLRDQPHLAVQIEPQGDRFRVPAQARAFLQKYFIQDSTPKMSIFWGRSEDFICQLYDRLNSSSNP